MVTNPVQGYLNMAKIGFDRALELFLDKFLELHPKTEWPTWFKTCTNYGGTEDQNKWWRFAFTAVSKQELGEGESWEFTPNGGVVLVKHDPRTGEKRYVISNYGNVITVFEALINPDSSEVIVTLDKDLASINGDELLPMRK